MKQLAAFLILILFSTAIFSQQVKIPTANKTDVKKFYATTTYVVLKNGFMSDYNDAIQEAVKKFWTATPVEFIKEGDFNKYRNDADKSFLMINKVWFDEDKSNTKFDFLILSLGGKYKTVNDMPTLCAIPLCYTGDDESKYIYKLGAMVKHCQTHMSICQQHPELTSETMADFYMKNSGTLADKNLCLLKDEVDASLRNASGMKSAYPYPTEFVSREQIEKLIFDSDEKTVIAHIISPLSGSELSFCVKIIIDAKTGMLYYYDTQRIKKNQDGYLLPNDLKKLSNKK